MKTNIVGIIIALILTFVGMLSVYAQDTKVSEVRKVDAFSSIEITSVGTIYFTQSDTYSFKIEGKEKHVKNTETTVKGGVTDSSDGSDWNMVSGTAGYED